MYNVDTLRAQEFPRLGDQVYLNNAAIAPLSERVQQRLKWAAAELGSNPIRFWQEHGQPETEAFAAAFSRLLGAQPVEITVATTTGSALNAVAAALPLEPGDNIIFCDVEFPANVFPWMDLTHSGVEARCIPAEDGGLTLDLMQRFTDSRTRVVAASAIQFFTGHKTDLASIGRFCRDNGILFIVDAIQAMGHMPIDVETMFIDVLASGGQKSLMSVPGIGVLYVRESLAETLRPRGLCANATIDFMHWLDYNLTPLPGAARFAGGTPNLLGVFATTAALSLIDELSVDDIATHTTHLAERTYEGILNLGFEPATSTRPNGPIVTFLSGISEAETDTMVEFLQARGLTAGKHLDASGNAYIRASFHCFNREQGVDRLIDRLAAWKNPPLHSPRSAAT